MTKKRSFVDSANESASKEVKNTMNEKLQSISDMFQLNDLQGTN